MAAANTSVIQYVGDGSVITTTNSFNADGSLKTSTAPNGSVTRILSYQCNGLYSASTTRAYGSTTVTPQTTSSVIDCNTGLTLQTTDANLVVTSYQYNDGLLRPTKVSYAGGKPQQSSVTYSYPSMHEVDVAKDQYVLSDGIHQTKVFSDGIGHDLETDVIGGTQTIHTISHYDLNGRLDSITNPFYTTQDLTYGTTYHHYDALGRETRTDLQDTSYIHTERSGNTVDTYDEAGTHWRRQYDILGLRKVFELGTVEKPVNYETDYDYDIFGNLTAVHQLGDGTSQSVERRFEYDALSRLTKACNPESLPEGQLCDGSHWSNTYLYDTSSNMVAKTDPRGVTVHYEYDELNRLTGKDYTGSNAAAQAIADATPPVQYGYDSIGGFRMPISNGIGRRTSMDDGEGFTMWSYDPAGRVTKMKRTTHSFTYPTMSYTYNLDGTPDVTYGWKHTYNATGQETGLAWPWNPTQKLVSDVTYAPSGQLASFKSGPNTTSYQFNKREQMSVLTANNTRYVDDVGPVTNTVLSLSYDYGPTGHNNGNIFGVLDNLSPSRTQSYTYDGVNRLLTATGGNWNMPFTYDPYGNLTSMGASNGGVQTGLNAGKNQLSVFPHDAAGNMLSNGATTLVYDAENRVIKAGGMKYGYDGDGQRVTRKPASAADDDDDETMYAFRNIEGQVVEDLGPDYFSYAYFQGKAVWNQTASNEFWPVQDHLGTTRESADIDGAPMPVQSYYPFGGIIGANTLGDQRMKFTGKERDSESGLEYFPARYYSSSMGRWMSPDPTSISYSDPRDPQTLNMYTYVANRPLIFTDPFGLSKDCGGGGDPSVVCILTSAWDKIKSWFGGGNGGGSNSGGASSQASGEQNPPREVVTVTLDFMNHHLPNFSGAGSSIGAQIGFGNGSARTQGLDYVKYTGQHGYSNPSETNKWIFMNTQGGTWPHYAPPGGRMVQNADGDGVFGFGQGLEGHVTLGRTSTDPTGTSQGRQLSLNILLFYGSYTFSGNWYNFSDYQFTLGLGSHGFGATSMTTSTTGSEADPPL